MTKLTIYLEPNLSGEFVFYPGHLLKGVVEISLEGAKKFRSCYVQICGHARAFWTETIESEKDSVKTKYEGKEAYLDSKTFLFGQFGSDSYEFPAGIHRYNFSCQLPEMLPESVKVTHGEIEYYIESVLDIPWRFDRKAVIPFTVARRDDLNFYPELKLPQRREEVKTFCCLHCQSDNLMMIVSVPHSGFSGGQTIPIIIEYFNRSNVEVEQTKIRLKRSITYTAHTPKKKTNTINEVVLEKLSSGVSTDESVEIECNLEIPRSILNSNFDFCHVMRIEYYLEVEGVVSGCNDNPQVKILIAIGSIPLRLENGAQNSYEDPPPSFYDLPQFNRNNNIESDLPPTFEEAIKMPRLRFSQKSLENFEN